MLHGNKFGNLDEMANFLEKCKFLKSVLEKEEPLTPRSISLGVFSNCKEIICVGGAGHQDRNNGK